jgi:hypothetical protein
VAACCFGSGLKSALRVFRIGILGYYGAIYLTVKNQGIRELFSNRIIESAPAEPLLLGQVVRGNVLPQWILAIPDG